MKVLKAVCCYYIIIIKMNMISDSKFASKFELY